MIKRLLIHFHFDAENTLSEEDVTDGIVDKVTSRLTRMDHETIGKFHRFCAGGPKLAGNYNLTTFSTRLHNKSEDTVAGTEKLIITAVTDRIEHLLLGHTGGWQGHQGVCNEETRIEQQQRVHGIELFRRKARGSFQGI